MWLGFGFSVCFFLGKIDCVAFKDELTKMLTLAAVRAVEFLVQSEPGSVHLGFGLVAYVQGGSVVFGREGRDFGFGEGDDLVGLRVEDFAEAVALS